MWKQLKMSSRNEKMKLLWNVLRADDLKKFHAGNTIFEDEEGRGHPSKVDDDQLKEIIEADPLKTTHKVEGELNVAQSTTGRH